MPRSYVLLSNGEKIAPFKYGNNLPYGALINTTKSGAYPVIQQIRHQNVPITFTWPSSEHAFHAQKIIHLMKKNPYDTNMQNILIGILRQIEATKSRLGEEFLPRDDWDPIVRTLTLNYPHLFGIDKAAFDALCDSNYHSSGNPHAGLMANGEPYTLSFMREVVQLKLEQHPALKQLAIDCAREGILPIEVSQYDMNWASGSGGRGANMLGILILELGNKFLQGQEPYTVLPIPNPKAYYQQLQRQNLQQLSHDSLVSYTLSMHSWKQPPPPGGQDTSSHVNQPIIQYFNSRYGNKRLVIQQNKIVGYEYRDNFSSPWVTSGDPLRFNDLINQYQQAQNSATQQDTQYFQSMGGNKRLVIQKNKIVSYEYRDDLSSPWMKSGAPSRFNDLINEFKQKQTPEKEKAQAEQEKTLASKKRQKYVTKVANQIEQVLLELDKKIGQIDQHHSTVAYQKAVSLLNELQDSRAQYIKKISDIEVKILDANTVFENRCKELIDDARPVLERDLSWGDYLTNLLKAIVNTFILIVSFGQANNFFTPATAALLEAAQEAESKLKLTDYKP